MKWIGSPVLILAAFSASALIVRGTISDSSQKPVEHAKVWVVQQPDVWMAESNAHGEFKVEGPSVGAVTVLAFKEGLALGGIDSPVIGDGDVAIILGEPDTLRLRIINHEFTAIEGVRMRALIVSDSFHVPVELLTSHGFPSIRSGSNGEMIVEGLPKGAWVRFTLGHPAYAEENIPYFPVGRALQQIPMKPGVTLAGRVTGAGKPLANARIGIFRPSTTGPKTITEFWSDPEGYFAGVLRPGEYYIAATHRDFITTKPQPLVLKPLDAKVSVPLTLEKALYVKGRLKYDAGPPAPGIEVGYFVDGMALEITLTDNDGRYRLKVGPGEGRIFTSPPNGYATRLASGIEVKDLTTPESAVPDITLTKIPVLRGKVLDESGVPAPKTIVGSYDTTPAVLDVTDASGEFEIHLQQLPASQTAAFFAESAERFQRATFKVDFSADTPVEARLKTYEAAALYENKDVSRNNLSLLVGKPAPPLSCEHWRNTEPLTIEGLKGKVVVLLLWGGFAMDKGGAASVREYNLLYDLYKDDGDVAVLGVHDAASLESDFDKYIKTYDVRFPVGQDIESAATFDLYDTTYIPQSILIDRKGILRFFDTGGRLLELIKVLRREAP